DSSDKLYVAGYTVQKDSNGDPANFPFVTTYDPTGKYRSSVSFDQHVTISSIATDAAGNVYVSGTFLGEETIANTKLSSTSGGNDAFVASYDSNGTPRWAKGFGGTASDSVTRLVLTQNGARVAIAGYFGGSFKFPGADNALNAVGISDTFV